MKKYVFLFLSKNEDIDETSASNHNSNFIANLLEKINMNLQNNNQKHNEPNLNTKNNNCLNPGNYKK